MDVDVLYSQDFVFYEVWLTMVIAGYSVDFQNRFLLKNWNFMSYSQSASLATMPKRR